MIQQYKIGKCNSQITLPLVLREPFSFTYFPVRVYGFGIPNVLVKQK